ncbi:MAG: hypothetical protein HY079_03030 [Elusimicrobia bacterium]|nr:hypothetical protein [Elusimicrobiota bacterium]
MTITLLLASALAASAAVPPAVGVSTAIAGAEQRLLERCSAPGGLDPAAALADRSRRDLELVSAGEARDLLAYASCRELQGVRDGCASLEGLVGALSGAAAHCREIAAHDRFVFAVLRGGDAAGACRAMFEPEGRRGPGVDRGCAAAIAAVRAGDARPACATLKTEKLIGPDEDCESHLSSWSGRSEECGRVKDPEAARDCRERAALVAGLRDRARCRASAACRALEEKAADACAGPAASFARAACARLSKSSAETKRLLTLEEQARQRERQHKAAEARREADARARHEALVKAKAAAQEKIQAEADAKKAKQAIKTQFSKDQPMKQSVDIKEVMKKLEKGEAPPSAPKPAADEEPAR